MCQENNMSLESAFEALIRKVGGYLRPDLEAVVAEAKAEEAQLRTELEAEVVKVKAQAEQDLSVAKADAAQALANAKSDALAELNTLTPKAKEAAIAAIERLVAEATKVLS